MNVFDLKPNDEVIFRCGGSAIVKEVKHNTEHGDTDIFFKGEALAHNYLKNGRDHELGQSLFDIVSVVKK